MQIEFSRNQWNTDEITYAYSYRFALRITRPCALSGRRLSKITPHNVKFSRNRTCGFPAYGSS